MNETGTQDDAEGKKPRGRGWLLILVSVLLIIVIGVLATLYAHEFQNREQYDKYGYIIAFVISFMAGATVIVYVPGVPVVFALGGVLHYPFLVGIAAGLGEALGEFTGYMVGRGGELYLRKAPTGKIQSKFYQLYSRIDAWMGKRGYLTVFLASAVFNPFFDFFGASAGAARMSPWKFYLACAAGKIVKATYVAYFGAWGLGWILEKFGYHLS